MRASASTNVTAQVGTHHADSEKSYSKACLSRRSAVVRGAVDTGYRRNYIVAVCSDGELKLKSEEEA